MWAAVARSPRLAARARTTRRSTKEDRWFCSPSAAAAVDLPSAVAAVAPSAVEGAERSAAGTERNAASLYWKLAKGKLTVWVSISAIPGYLLAVPAAVDPVALTALATGTFLTSASAQTMNQIIEVDRDARMHRTAKRPLPSGALSTNDAVRFAVGSGACGLLVLSAGATPATAAIAATTMVTYAAVYTPLKVLSPYNTHVGAVSGALPTTMGFAAALGSGLLASPWAAHAAWLFAMQVLWQMPHFYALAWIHRADYIRGGYNMFPLGDTTGTLTAAMCKPYLVALCALPCVASAAGLASWMLPVWAALPSAMWWRSLQNFEQNPNIATCRRFFLGSLSYLLTTLALFTACARVEQQDGETSLTKIEEPRWRSALGARLAEFCPHENMKADLCGFLESSCPLGERAGRARAASARCNDGAAGTTPPSSQH